MSKNNFKKKLMAVLAVAAVGVATLGVATVNQASADTDSFTMDDITVSMQYGASVRIPDETYTLGGLRYTMEMSLVDYETLMENVGAGKAYTNVEFGVFVAPEYYNDLLTIDETSVQGETAKYGWLTEEEKAAGTEWVASEAGQKNLLQIINVQSDTMTDGEDEDKNAVKVFYGSVVDMFEENMLTEYIGVGYIRYTDASGTHYEFATANDNVRSMTYVAQRAIEKGEDKEDTLKDTYVAPFAQTETEYTVDYYFRNATGEYVKDENSSESVSSKIGETVDLAGKAIDGYKLVEAKTQDGLVYANKKSVFALYYRPETNLYDFEKDEAVQTGFSGNAPGEEKISIVAAPGREGDTALCMEDTGTQSTAYLLMNGLTKDKLSALTKYDMVDFDIYVEAATNVDFYPYTNSNTATGLSGKLAANQWRTYSVRIADILNNGNANYLRFWNTTVGYKVYISNITLSKWDGLVSDWDTQLVAGISLSGATASSAKLSVIADPTESGRGNVYKWATNNGAGSHNASASWPNIATYVEWAKAAGFDSLSIDVYSTQTTSNTLITINNWLFKRTKVGEWETITVKFDAAKQAQNVMWMQKGTDCILFDNFRFTKSA